MLSQYYCIHTTTRFCLCPYTDLSFHLFFRWRSSKAASEQRVRLWRPRSWASYPHTPALKSAKKPSTESKVSTLQRHVSVFSLKFDYFLAASDGSWSHAVTPCAASAHLPSLRGLWRHLVSCGKSSRALSVVTLWWLWRHPAAFPLDRVRAQLEGTGRALCRRRENYFLSRVCMELTASSRQHSCCEYCSCSITAYMITNGIWCFLL